MKSVNGFTAVGYNANWLRRGENTLKILQKLGFTYYICDLSRNEPFIIQVNKKDFTVVPYTIRCNDIVLIEGKNFSSDQFFNQLKAEFDQLDLLEYIKKHNGMTFKRKDEIAKMTLEDKTSIRE